VNLASTSRRSAWLLALVVLVGACSQGAGAQDRAELTGAITADAADRDETTPTTAGTGAFVPVHEDEDEDAWPGSDWAEVSAGAAGLDRAALDEMAAAAERAGSQCLVVTKDGELVGEWYWDGFGPGTEREVFSVTKSITSTLVGIAQDRGLLDIDDRASDYIEAWQGTPS
jgi:CubicO group peptidase (beta-lactamase class C family)